jgi:hypothetical protein
MPIAIATPALTQEWLRLGSKVVCKEPFSVPIELVGVTGDFHVKKGDVAEIIEIDSYEVEVGYFDLFGTGKKNGYVRQLRGDFVYNWEPVESVTARGLVERAKVSMIIDRHPDAPGAKTKQRHIGYWASHEDPAVCRYAQGGTMLPWPGDFVDPTWDPRERDRVIAYVDGAPNVEHWMGYSFCRLGCDEDDMGVSDKGDDKFIWPEGFGHYLRVHGVRPPEEFVRHVLAKLR